MPDPNGRRRPSKLSAETKWEIFLQVTSGEIAQAEATRKWGVDVSTVIGIRRTVKDAALAALARKSGRPATQRDWQLEAARGDARAELRLHRVEIERAARRREPQIDLELLAGRARHDAVQARAREDLKKLVMDGLV